VVARSSLEDEDLAWEGMMPRKHELEAWLLGAAAEQSNARLQYSVLRHGLLAAVDAGRLQDSVFGDPGAIADRHG
jgi:hypothetical protein